MLLWLRLWDVSLQVNKTFNGSLAHIYTKRMILWLCLFAKKSISAVLLTRLHYIFHAWLFVLYTIIMFSIIHNESRVRSFLVTRDHRCPCNRGILESLNLVGLFVVSSKSTEFIIRLQKTANRLTATDYGNVEQVSTLKSVEVTSQIPFTNLYQLRKRLGQSV